MVKKTSFNITNITKSPDFIKKMDFVPFPLDYTNKRVSELLQSPEKQKDYLVNKRNFISKEIKEKHDFTDSDISVSDGILKDFNGGDLNFDEYGNIVINGKPQYNEFDKFLKFLIPCFYLNPELTASILRSFCDGNHGDVFGKLRSLNIEFKNELLPYLSYYLDFSGGLVQDLEEKLIGKGVLKIFALSDYVSDEKNDYSNLSDEKMLSIIYELYWFGVLKNQMMNSKPDNKSLIDRVFKMKGKVKENIFNGVLGYLKSGYKGEEKLALDGEENFLEDGDNEIISEIEYCEKEKKNGFTYNPEGFKILKEIFIQDEEEKAKRIFKAIIGESFDEAMMIIRSNSNGNHAIIKSLLEELDQETLVKILRDGIILPEEVNTKSCEEHGFTIFRSISLLPFNKLGPIINGLEVEEIKNGLKILFYLRLNKDYPIARIRHICKSENFNTTKILKAFLRLKNEEKIIGDFLEKNVLSKFSEEEGSKFDYNLSKRSPKSDAIFTSNNLIGNLIHNLNNQAFLYDNYDNGKDHKLFLQYSFEYNLISVLVNPLIKKNIEKKQDYIDYFISKKGRLGEGEKYNKLLETIENTDLEVLLSGSFILQQIQPFLDILDRESTSITMSGNSKKQEGDKKFKKDIDTLIRFIGKNDFEKGNSVNLKKIDGLNSDGTSGRIKILKMTDKEGFKNLNENDIVICDNYTTNYIKLNNFTKPRAIIFGNKVSSGGHSTNFAKQHDIPCFQLNKAEEYFRELNGCYVEIGEDGNLKLLEQENHINPYQEDKNKTGEKFNGLGESDLKPISLSGDIFYEVLTGFYNISGKEISRDNDLNYVLQLPFEDLRQIFDKLRHGGNINYDELSKQVYDVLESVSIKPEVIDKLVNEKNIKFPLALRSDYLNEDKNGVRNAGSKNSYLNVRNEQEFSKFLMEMIKQDFSPQQLKYKVENNIYPAFCTFGAVIQPMVIKEEDEARDLLSGVASVSLDESGEFIIRNGVFCLGLNEGITSSTLGISTFNSSLDGKEEQNINQPTYITLDNDKGGTKKAYGNLSFKFSSEIQDYIKQELLKNSINDLENPNLKTEYGDFEISFEFSVKNGTFVLLQKNLIKRIK